VPKSQHCFNFLLGLFERSCVAFSSLALNFGLCSWHATHPSARWFCRFAAGVASDGETLILVHIPKIWGMHYAGKRHALACIGHIPQAGHALTSAQLLGGAKETTEVGPND
jgi:hypothetical protein